jgi:hypothetical protein
VKATSAHYQHEREQQRHVRRDEECGRAIEVVEHDGEHRDDHGRHGVPQGHAEGGLAAAIHGVTIDTLAILRSLLLQ